MARVICIRCQRSALNVPVPAELVSLLRGHLERFGTGEDGRIFLGSSAARKQPNQPSTWWQIWREVRRLTAHPRPARDATGPLL
jgi:hypothetical protein